MAITSSKTAELKTDTVPEVDEDDWKAFDEAGKVRDKAICQSWNFIVPIEKKQSKMSSMEAPVEENLT